MQLEVPFLRFLAKTYCIGTSSFLSFHLDYGLFKRIRPPKNTWLYTIPCDNISMSDTREKIKRQKSNPTVQSVGMWLKCGRYFWNRERAAKRELRDETGYESSDWVNLGNKCVFTLLSRFFLAFFSVRKIHYYKPLAYLSFYLTEKLYDSFY